MNVGQLGSVTAGLLLICALQEIGVVTYVGGSDIREPQQAKEGVKHPAELIYSLLRANGHTSEYVENGDYTNATPSHVILASSQNRKSWLESRRGSEAHGNRSDELHVSGTAKEKLHSASTTIAPFIHGNGFGSENKHSLLETMENVVPGKPRTKRNNPAYINVLSGLPTYYPQYQLPNYNKQNPYNTLSQDHANAIYAQAPISQYGNIDVPWWPNDENIRSGVHSALGLQGPFSSEIVRPLPNGNQVAYGDNGQFQQNHPDPGQEMVNEGPPDTSESEIYRPGSQYPIRYVNQASDVREDSSPRETNAFPQTVEANTFHLSEPSPLHPNHMDESPTFSAEPSDTIHPNQNFKMGKYQLEHPKITQPLSNKDEHLHQDSTNKEDDGSTASVSSHVNANTDLLAETVNESRELVPGSPVREAYDTSEPPIEHEHLVANQPVEDTVQIYGNNDPAKGYKMLDQQVPNNIDAYGPSDNSALEPGQGIIGSLNQYWEQTGKFGPGGFHEEPTKEPIQGTLLREAEQENNVTVNENQKDLKTPQKYDTSEVNPAPYKINTPDQPDQEKTAPIADDGNARNELEYETQPTKGGIASHGVPDNSATQEALTPHDDTTEVKAEVERYNETKIEQNIEDDDPSQKSIGLTQQINSEIELNGPSDDHATQPMLNVLQNPTESEDVFQKHHIEGFMEGSIKESIKSLLSNTGEPGMDGVAREASENTTTVVQGSAAANTENESVNLNVESSTNDKMILNYGGGGEGFGQQDVDTKPISDSKAAGLNAEGNKGVIEPVHDEATHEGYGDIKNNKEQLFDGSSPIPLLTNTKEIIDGDKDIIQFVTDNGPQAPFTFIDSQSKEINPMNWAGYVQPVTVESGFVQPYAGSSSNIYNSAENPLTEPAESVFQKTKPAGIVNPTTNAEGKALVLEGVEARENVTHLPKADFSDAFGSVDDNNSATVMGNASVLGDQLESKTQPSNDENRPTVAVADETSGAQLTDSAQQSYGVSTNTGVDAGNQSGLSSTNLPQNSSLKVDLDKSDDNTPLNQTQEKENGIVSSEATAVADSQANTSSGVSASSEKTKVTLEEQVSMNGNNLMHDSGSSVGDSPSGNETETEVKVRSHMLPGEKMAQTSKKATKSYPPRLNTGKSQTNQNSAQFGQEASIQPPLSKKKRGKKKGRNKGNVAVSVNQRDSVPNLAPTSGVAQRLVPLWYRPPNMQETPAGQQHLPQHQLQQQQLQQQKLQQQQLHQQQQLFTQGTAARIYDVPSEIPYQLGPGHPFMLAEPGYVYTAM